MCRMNVYQMMFDRSFLSLYTVILVSFRQNVGLAFSDYLSC